MILAAIIALSGVVLLVIANMFRAVPSFPNSVVDMMNAFLNYLTSGIGFLYNFCHPEVVKTMMAFTLAVILIYEGYKLVMWAVKKIPMFGVSD